MLSNLETIGWKKKIPKTAQIKFGCQKNFLNAFFYKLDKHVVLSPINHIAG